MTLKNSLSIECQIVRGKSFFYAIELFLKMGVRYPTGWGHHKLKLCSQWALKVYGQTIPNQTYEWVVQIDSVKLLPRHNVTGKSNAQWGVRKTGCEERTEGRTRAPHKKAKKQDGIFGNGTPHVDLGSVFFSRAGSQFGGDTQSLKIFDIFSTLPWHLRHKNRHN